MKHVIVAVALLVGACAPDESASSRNDSGNSQSVAMEARTDADAAPYTFDEPALSFVLPQELREISGLTVLPDGRLATVQDEEGIVFVVSPETGTLEARLPFGDTGDYEGVEWVGDTGYVLRSDGTLLELAGWPGEARLAKTHNTSLKSKNDTEGLGYDAAGGRLLIACKEDPGSDLGKDHRAVYAFDLESGELAESPAFVIDEDEIARHLSKKRPFKPSSIAVHPVDGTAYVLSATAAAIAVLGGDGAVQHVWELPRSMFEQAEGLAFVDDGTLYISSEGGDGPGMLYKYTFRGSE